MNCTHSMQGIFVSHKVFTVLFILCLPAVNSSGQALSRAHQKEKGKVTFNSSDDQLNHSYQWAKKQALAYAFEGDPVGLWYEAALPGREAFCMRDVSHQSLGAHVLRLDLYTKNIMYKFAQNISESKDWCSYWEINRYDKPAPVDYVSDSAFWYNLPANFDVMDAIYRIYLWTGDRSYISDPDFLNFYTRTVDDYVRRWDLGVDKIMSRKRIMNQHSGEYRFKDARGIPGYEESDKKFVVGIDQLAVQYAAYKAFSDIQILRGNKAEAGKFLGKAEEMQKLIETKWWDEEKQLYYTHLNTAYHLYGEGSPDVLYYEASDDSKHIKAILDHIIKNLNKPPLRNVENLSHIPEILYNYERSQPAYDLLLALTKHERREYPEVSFSVMGTITKGLMGIRPRIHARSKSSPTSRKFYHYVTTISRLTKETAWANIGNLQVRENKISVRHEGLTKTILTNQTGPALTWRACFPGSYTKLIVNGKAVEAVQEAAYPGGPMISWVEVVVENGKTMSVQVG